MTRGSRSVDGSSVVAVTGASGAVGSRVGRRLAGAGASTRLIVRDPAGLVETARDDVRTIRGYDDATSVEAALEHVDTLLLIPASESPGRSAEHLTVIEAAQRAGVRRVVYLSFVGAAPDATFSFARQHWETEECLRRSGLAWTVLRMSLFTDVLPAFASPEGWVRGPAGDGRFAPVARDDVAAATTATLLSAQHRGKTYNLTGPQRLTMADVAHALSRAAGTPVHYDNESDEIAYARRAGAGTTFDVRGWVTSYQAIRDGSMDVLSPAVAELTGRPAMSVERWLRRHPTALAHLAPAETGR